MKIIKLKITGSLSERILRINPYLLATLIISFVALLCIPLSNPDSYHLVSLILLAVVTIMATFMKLGPILLASSLSAIVWNYFFIPPQFTFHIEKTEDIFMFFMFFIIALLNGVLTTRIRKQERLALEREERTNALFQLNKELSLCGSLTELVLASNNNIRKTFTVDNIAFIQNKEDKLLLPDEAKFFTDLRNEIEIAGWALKNEKPAGRFTKYYNNTTYTFYPLLGNQIKPGVIVINQEKPFPGEKLIFWQTYLNQISNAFEREFLAGLARKAELLDESDRLYKTLFNSISHEFRIPVSTIMGAADTLMSSPHPESVQTVLYDEIFTATVRLNRLIENLLNMSRLESGRITLRFDWYDILDLINKVLVDLKDELKPFFVNISIPEDLPLIYIDFGLMEQVIYNLLINSCERAPVATEIKIIASVERNQLLLKIMDSGPGIPEENIKNIFGKFFKDGNHKTGGLGLGLSIVKGFCEAHKGTVSAENRKEGGACFTVELPSLHPQFNKMENEPG